MSSRQGSVKVSAARFGALGFLAIGLGCAALAALLIGDMMSSRYAGTKVVSVVVASSEIRAGHALTADVLALRDWPEDSVPTGAFHRIEDALAAHEGATFTVAVLAGEPVVAARLSGAQTGTAMAALIRPNMRAFALKVDDSIGFTGLVYPGAHVDVVATIRDPGGRGPSSRIAVQHARVLSVNMDVDVATRRIQQQRTDRMTNSPETSTYLTLEVTPEEAEILSIARNEGRIDVALRNATDDRLVRTMGATPALFSAFAADEEGAEAPPQQAARRTNPARAPRTQLSPRRVQIVANDEPDSTPARGRTGDTSGRIETYHAN
jgi:pilus assembly protein CpaB